MAVTKSIYLIRLDNVSALSRTVNKFSKNDFSGEVVGCEEVGQVRFELVVSVVEVAFDGGVFDGPIHALDLPVGPGMVG